MKRMLLLGAAIVLSLAAIGVAGCDDSGGATAEVGEVPQTVAAVGNGKASAAPDKVEFGFGVNVTDKTGKGAMAKAATASDKIVKALEAAGIKKEDIQTQNLSLYPRYDDKGRTVIGYEVTVSVRASTEDLESAPKVIEGATNAGATQINGPSFSMSKDNAAHDRALEDAVDDARARAEVMAKAAGREIGDVVRIAESSAVGVYPMVSGARFLATADAAAAPSLEPGQLDAFATVTVEFELR